MAVDVFHDKTSSIPKGGDSRIERIDFEKSDIGARKSHVSKGFHKSEYSIKHVKGS